jgi:hypothetical protein
MHMLHAKSIGARDVWDICTPYPTGFMAIWKNPPANQDRRVRWDMVGNTISRTVVVHDILAGNPMLCLNPRFL